MITPDQHTDPADVSKDTERKVQLSDTRLPPVVILFIVFLLIDPTLTPAFIVDARSDRTIYAYAVVFATKAEKLSRQHLGTTKPIPSSSYLPLSLYLYPRNIFVFVVVTSSFS